jgi:hypothetical protein
LFALLWHFSDSPIFGRVLKTAAAIAFLLLLLIPTIGIIGKFNDDIILPPASAQFSFANPNENNTNTIQGSDVLPTTNNTLLLRGLIGSTISTDNANATNFGLPTAQGDYTVAGRWRMFVNESLIQRFVANLTLARTDGSKNYNIVIENIEHSEFSRNVPSHMNVQIYANSSLPSIILPVTVEIKGDNKVLKISDISINEGQVEDSQQRDILGILDGQSIYGIVMSVE